MELWGIPRVLLAGAQGPPRDVHRPLWTLWLLLPGKACTDTVLGEWGFASLPKEI